MKLQANWFRILALRWKHNHCRLENKSLRQRGSESYHELLVKLQLHSMSDMSSVRFGGVYLQLRCAYGFGNS